MKPIDMLIDRHANMKCTICGKPAGTCECWEQCSCGYATERGTPCGNPDTARCSTKLKYGKYNRKTKRYE